MAPRPLRTEVLMRIKLNDVKRPTGIPSARVDVLPGRTDMAQDLAGRLVDAAGRAVKL